MSDIAMAYTITEFVDDLRAAAPLGDPEDAIIARVAPLAERFAAQPGWTDEKYRACDPGQGFGTHLLHEEDDHSLAVFIFAWLPGRGTPPHDHRTWAVVTGIDGTETNIDWRRLDDGSRPGYAEIEQTGSHTLGPGDTDTLTSAQIHTVQNDGDAVTISLHIYGRHVNHTNRSRFDPENNAELSYDVVVD